jgi:hypothetical protein
VLLAQLLVELGHLFAQIDLREQMPELYEKLREEHEQWQKEKLRTKPMWPRIMDKKFVLDGKEYLFPA